MNALVFIHTLLSGAHILSNLLCKQERRCFSLPFYLGTVLHYIRFNNHNMDILFHRHFRGI